MAESQRRPGMVWLALGFEGGLLALAVLLGWLTDEPPLEQCAWSPADAAAGLSATAPLVMLYFIGMRFPIGSLRDVKAVLEEVVAPLFRTASVLDLALISLCAGLGEEALFRGVIQAWLAGRFGAVVGLLLTSLLFGLAHCVTATYAVLAALVGLYLGGLQIMTDNLLAPVIAHGLYDFVVLLLLVRKRSR